MQGRHPKRHISSGATHRPPALISSAALPASSHLPPNIQLLFLARRNHQGRYELLTRAEAKHRSATCVVHFALDHGEEPPVERVLKFMRNREQWSREVAVRGGVADGGHFAAAVGSAAEASEPASSATIAAGATGEATAATKEATGAAAPASAEAAAAAEGTGAKRRLNEEHVLPVLRMHELPPEETTEKRAFAGAEAYPFVLVMERGDEDLDGARLTPPLHLRLPLRARHTLFLRHCARSPMPAKRPAQPASCNA